MKSTLRSALYVVLLVALFVLGYSWRDLQRGTATSTDSLRAMLGLAPTSQNYSAKELYRQTYKRIVTDYYRKVDPTEVKYASMEGLVSSLGDPHTVFLDRRASQEFAMETRANFVGVGARLTPDPLGAKVVNVFEDGPAKKAGLRNGDVITGVDNATTAGMQIDLIVRRIRGQDGTVVKLHILREANPKGLVIAIRRAQVTAPTVDFQVLPGTQMGYLSITQFSDPTTEQFDAALDKVDSSNVRGLIIDLRGNPGGLLETAVEMLSRFVEDKVVVKMKGRGGVERIAKSESGYLHPIHVPIVLLVNEDSASAAEIFAGVLRDYKLATLVGEHTYGKASVQEVRNLADGASAKITIARYYLPSGSDISRRVDDDGQYLSGGIEPDVKVELNLDLSPLLGDLKTDSQLQKAVQVAESKR